MWNKIITISLLVIVSNATAQICKKETIPATTPTARFEINGDGTVTDELTGLMWKRCLEGQSGIGCTQISAQAFIWEAAKQQADNVNKKSRFAGYSDWRIPNIKELSSIVENKCHDPAINLSVFPNTPSIFVWSSTPSISGKNHAWGVDFSSGYAGYSLRDSADKSVRLVRSTD